MQSQLLCIMLVFVAVVARSPRTVRFASTTRFPRTTRLPSSRDGALGDGRRSYPRRPGPLDGKLENEGGAFEEDGRRSYPLDGRPERGGGYSNPRDRQGSDLPSRSAPAPLRRDPAGDSPAPRARSSELYNRYNRDLRTGADMERERFKPPSQLWDFDGDHLYGVSTIRAALMANKRNMTELLVQEGMDVANKKDEAGASEILARAAELKIPVKQFSKHDLNMLSDNRPHQGFILRAAPMQFIRKDSMESTAGAFKCVLALDEVWDPQNFGALLRTCHFLGVDKVVVCAKNSAPLSPTVSKASSGAMELMDVYSTDNLMKFLDKSCEAGWQVVGTKLDPTALDLVNLPLLKPTILVLGNEGHGIRTNVIRRCTHLVKISSSDSGSGGDEGGVVDSLNVSVTGGIMLHHILSAGRAGSTAKQKT